MARAKDRQAVLNRRIVGLAQAVQAARGRSDDAVVNEALRVIRQADRRLAFSGDVTVVALAGSTGSGKSSLFNAIAGVELAETGVKRPTTSRAMGAYWGSQSPAELLDWLEIPRRHLVQGGRSELDGLLLIDLPDHDSTQVEHQMEVDRLVALVDVLIWVVDPQKYADALLHERYLRPLASHADVMLVVLNQADRLSPTEVDKTIDDLRRLLDEGGLAKTPVVEASALTGHHVDVLRRFLQRKVSDKQAAAERLNADLAKAAQELQTDLGAGGLAEVPLARVNQLDQALAAAAGVPKVDQAVAQAWRHRGVSATGWPVVNWIIKLRPDPLRRLHLDPLRGRKRRMLETDPLTVPRTSLAVTGGVQEAPVDSAIRALADDVSVDLPRGWVSAVRAASLSNRKTLPDDLDRAVATTDLGMDRGHGWWSGIRVLQWVLIVALVVGLLWFGADFVLAYFRLPQLPPVMWGRLEARAWLVLGAVIIGILLALLSRLFVEWGARVKAASARRTLRRAISVVSDQAIIEPVNVELDAYRRAQEGVREALR